MDEDQLSYLGREYQREWMKRDGES